MIGQSALRAPCVRCVWQPAQRLGEHRFVAGRPAQSYLGQRIPHALQLRRGRPAADGAGSRQQPDDADPRPVGPQDEHERSGHGRVAVSLRCGGQPGETARCALPGDLLLLRRPQSAGGQDLSCGHQQPGHPDVQRGLCRRLQLRQHGERQPGQGPTHGHERSIGQQRLGL